MCIFSLSECQGEYVTTSDSTTSIVLSRKVLAQRKALTQLTPHLS